MKRFYLIGIAGPSCSGKSELSKYMSVLLSAPILSLDHYYRDLTHLPVDERAIQNFDHPDALDWPLLERDVRELAAGKPVDVYTYDFARHTRSSGIEHIPACEYVIVEGLFALHHPDIRRQLGLKVFVAVPDEVCLDRRLERDIRERARTRESVLSQYAATVRPMCEQFILPTRQFADLVVSGTDRLEQSAGRVRHALRAALSPEPSLHAPNA